MRNKKQDKATDVPSRWQCLLNKIEGFIARVRGLPEDEAKALVTEQCEAVFNEHFEADSSLEVAKAQAETTRDIANKQKKSVSEALLSTPMYLETPPDKDAQGFLSDLNCLRFGDGIQLVIFAVLTGLSMVVSYQNVLASLLGTGMPLFIDSPSKAHFLALLAPSVAAAIKNLPAMFKTEASQCLCKRGIYAVAGISSLAWVALFAANFDGLSGNMPDISSFSLDGSSRGNWLTFIQVFTEVTVSASLFLRFSDILKIYEPANKKDNPEYHKLQAALAQAEVAVKAADKNFKEANDALSQHQASRQAFISEALARLSVAQMKYQDLHR